MKLIGSMTEKTIRDELMKSRESLLVRGHYPHLLSALRRHFPEMESALILNWVLDKNLTEKLRSDPKRTGSATSFPDLRAPDYGSGTCRSAVLQMAW